MKRNTQIRLSKNNKNKLTNEDIAQNTRKLKNEDSTDEITARRYVQATHVNKEQQYTHRD